MFTALVGPPWSAAPSVLAAVLELWLLRHLLAACDQCADLVSLYSNSTTLRLSVPHRIRDGSLTFV